MALQPWAIGLAGAAAVLVAIGGIWITRERQQRLVPQPSPPSLVAAELEILDAGEVASSLPTRAAGAKLRAAANHRLLVRVGRDLIGVREQGVVHIMRADASETRLTLEAGSVACGVDRRAPGQLFVVETAGHVVQVIGTRFLVTRGANNSVDVAVEAGTVEVRDRRDDTMRLPAGTSMRFTEDEHEPAREIAAEEHTTLAQLLDLRVSAAKPSRALQQQRRAPVPPNVTIPRDLEGWRERILRGDLAGAEAAISAYLTGVPRDAEAWWLLGEARRKARKWPAAVTAYRRVIDLGDTSVANQARFVAATILQDEMKRPTEALPLLRTYLRQGAPLRPLEAAAMVRQARALLTLGKSKQADAVLRDVLSRHPNTEAAREAQALMDSAGR